jgi:putative salt-induced outer membrane protein YdiY
MPIVHPYFLGNVRQAVEKWPRRSRAGGGDASVGMGWRGSGVVPRGEAQNALIDMAMLATSVSLSFEKRSLRKCRLCMAVVARMFRPGLAAGHGRALMKTLIGIALGLGLLFSGGATSQELPSLAMEQTDVVEGNEAVAEDSGGEESDSMSPRQLKDLELYGPLPEIDDSVWFDPLQIQRSWDISFELGLTGNRGNSQTFNVQSGLDLERKQDLWNTFIRFRYTNAYATGTEVKNNMLFKVGRERELGDSRWSLFGRSDLLFDRFRNFDYRWVANAGFGYVLFKDDATMLKARLGAGTSREFGAPEARWSPEGVIGLDFKRQLTKRQKFSMTVDYYPEMDLLDQFRLVTEANWEMLIDDAGNLSLKFNARDEYDSTPEGSKPNDLNYAFLLLWKF